MKYKAVIFDLDGVICSTDEYHYLAWKSLADRLDIPFDREEYSHLLGVSRLESLELILKKSSRTFTEAEKATLAEEKNAQYRRLLDQMSPADLSEEVRDTLNRLRRAGLKLAIGSSSQNTPFILERIGLSHFFDAVADGNCITHSKPDPEVFLKAAEMIRLQPGECLVVEDARAGVTAAIRGGFDCAVMGDAREDERATWHLNTFSELLGCFSELITT
ncbi:MAG: beta-phosphoglucomutase [Clostridia bacterium]|nr:beta-phosphoglucomutase [Clostridia bacterium]